MAATKWGALRAALGGDTRGLVGRDHPAVAADVAALAALVQGQGHLDEAEALYRRAIAMFEAALGPDHYEIAVNCSNLGALHAARGEDAEAEELYRRALRIKQQVLGRDHPDVAMTVHNLAVLRAGQDRVEEAEALYRRALGLGTRLGLRPKTHLPPGARSCSPGRTVEPPSRT